MGREIKRVPLNFDWPLNEIWPDKEPPKGDGYQLWEDTTEGSPISPVFKTPNGLAKWLADNKIDAGGSMTCTYDEWLTFINEYGWAPSMIKINRKLKSGVAACTDLKKRDDQIK